tara:strand:+ start:266748 stop:267764 length:1017 start_codon:yes stop_codon:yes gene_type:complete
MKLLILIFLVGAIGCQTPLHKRDSAPTPSRPETDRPNATRPKDSTSTPPTTTTQPPAEAEDNRPVVDDNMAPDEVESDNRPPKPVPRLPKVGVIFGPGGGKVFGQIGVLQEFQKNKIPIYNVAGIEMGALAASLYAWRGSANDMEWQMFKIKSEDIIKKGLISSKRAGDFDVIQSIVKSALHNLKAEDFKKPFACPALNLEKNKMYVMNRGNIEALLPYCIPYPPLFKPYQKNISAVRELKALADHLRKQGANYIVLINVLGGSAFKTPINESDSVENLVWAEISSQMVKESAHVDHTITINLDSYSVLDFENKRDMMQKGSSQANRAVRSLAEKLGL